MSRRNRKIGKALVIGGITVLLLSFCSFEFIITSLAIISIIVGTKLLICS